MIKINFVLSLALLNFTASVFGVGQKVISENITFDSVSTKLSGTLVYPFERKIDSAIVFVHGSGKQTRNFELANEFALRGIAVFVYDKRGVGESEGNYEGKQSVSEKNIRLLAKDAAAAVKLLRRHPKTKGLSIGLSGISQAGWIVPLAAEEYTKVDYLVLWSGPVCKVSEEDIYSKFTRDQDNKSVPTYMEALNARKRPYRWPNFLGKDTDPSESLKNLSIPGLWVFGGQDGSIPVDLSITRLNELQTLGRPYEYKIFEHSGHNNIPETFSYVVTWIQSLSLPIHTD